MDVNDKIDIAMAWLRKQDMDVVMEVATSMLAYAIETEWVNVWPPEDIEEMVAEELHDAIIEVPETLAIILRKDYQKPYYVTCGDPIV